MTSLMEVDDKVVVPAVKNEVKNEQENNDADSGDDSEHLSQ